MATESERPSRGLELLWGRRDRPGRGPKPKLSVDRIVASAIEIADREGIDAVSMQRVATDHGYTTMSLYRYVPGKDELLDLMIDTALGPPPPLADLGTGWRAQLEGWIDRMWAVYVRHPWVGQVQVSRPPMGPNQLSWFECGLQAMADTGLTSDEKVFACVFLSAAVRGLAGVGNELRAAQSAGGLGMVSEYGAALATLIDPERFPALVGVVADGTFGVPGAEPGTAEDASLADVRPELEFGIQRFLDGIEAKAGRRGRRRS